MPNYTPVLNLVKPVGPEQFNVSHANENADKIDAQVALLAPKANPTFTGTIIGENTQLSGHLVGTGNALLEGRFGGVARGYIWNDTAGIAILNDIGDVVLRSPSGTNDISIPHRLDLTGGQIKFPATQVPSSDPNTLDDYEEGSFTPTTPTPNVNVTVNAAFYTKIGRQVFAYCFVTLTNTSASTISQYSITGLPFLSIIFGEVSSYYEGIRPIFSFIEANTIEAKLGQDLNVGDNSRMFAFSYLTN